ncbi:hypothetical protein M2451_002927 [Dysgonomonas sp. PFB1-18]|uniref:hypothetical protein n=1 Tax=unclassified Dysgonomonas TaxID=2630389 RepID=UPI0013D236AC|nr:MULTISPECIES: hypothetical protein [unclassified Dysgonomonas]MDH6310037.1 hypothetical protein [Dysgonomonas sp. PF1-14]MDH6339946.1 hypothetical protein [Dysgonomonas sp. PF1-16]MDH6381594.1 hypothetical protein [Dysgonomonas sp. PFB1-18]MDH6398769.1 hypothetical protein [Dysgonomonas sp. PF1-23]
MDKFDIKLFKENEHAKVYTYKKGKETISLFDLSDVYRKSIYYEDNAFEDHISYFKEELTVCGIYRKLYNMYIGTIKYYDINGNLEKERNMDAPFPYSIDDVRNWIKKKYDVDIFEKKEGYMMSRSETPIPHYMLKFLTKDGKFIMYSINGVNGEIIFQNINGEEKEVNPVDWAKEAAKRKEQKE